MKLLAWNPHELGNPRGVRSLQYLLQMEDLDVLFLQETKVKAFFFALKNFLLIFMVAWLSIVLVEGGLALMWK